MDFKRITVISGHFGSGKTGIAVNMAFDLKKRHGSAAIADLDIVNPYFRTKDSEKMLSGAGIRLICSEYANTKVDIPALPQDIYAITDDRSLYSIIDVGGDDRGALALGRISPEIRRENDYDMLYVVNMYRPLTSDPESAAEVMREIEAACGLRFTAIVNNSNLGRETTAETVLRSCGYADEICRITGLPLRMTSAVQSLCPVLSGKINGLYPLVLKEQQ